jgi:hypothetical protein
MLDCRITGPSASHLQIRAGDGFAKFGVGEMARLSREIVVYFRLQSSGEYLSMGPSSGLRRPLGLAVPLIMQMTADE